MFDTILAPLDGSKIAEQSLPYVTELARTFGSEITILGVCESGNTVEGEACNITIGDTAETLRKSLAGTGAKVKSVVLSGGPARQITAYAEQNKTDLIVLTSHGRSGISPWPLGSTVRKMLDMRARVPILIVRAKEPADECKTELFSRIVMPLDGSARGEAALPYILELAKYISMEVILLQVMETERHVHGGWGAGLRQIRFPEQDIVKEQESAQDYLNDIAGQFTGTKAQVRTIVRSGDPAKEIMNFTNEIGYCLIAMGSHGHSGIDVWIYGSTTYKILDSSDKSLLLVKTIPGI